MPHIILASASPRRRDLLAQIGITPEIIPSSVEEHITKSLPQDIVLELSSQKCRDVASSQSAAGQPGDTVVIGADTIVTLDGRILGKPADADDAASMLRSLRGRTHAVYTGVTAILLRDGQPVREESFSEETFVSVAPMSELEIREYVRSGEPLDKAGAYGIQGLFAKFITGIRGDYFNVVGLPVCHLWQVMRDLTDTTEMTEVNCDEE